VTVSIIAAMTRHGRVIGVDNKLPWHLSEDLKRFKRLTMGHHLIMGRKTFESIGKPLPGRKNIVITTNANFAAGSGYKFEEFEINTDAPKALGAAHKSRDEYFVIGGEQIFKAALAFADKFYFTFIDEEFPGDAFFPPFQLEDYRMTERSNHQGEAFTYSFETWERGS
jgi:dihydrofolate reductase